ncbi:MAG: DUF1467 family protein [Alphaproteobacteria bacterium]
MGPVTGILVYVITWFVVLFAVLPWGAEPPEHPEPGHAESAPERPRLALKFAVTSVAAAVIWLVVYGLIEADILSFRDLARDL